ncbi:MAG: class A beta-lactamase-related serine hydrolase [Gemmatimonadales bacterium]|nr:MAG: class A beta-lactamase-related serine hydrolase [Gemmatimonadales bacterium]
MDCRLMRSLVLAGLAATLLWLHGWASASVPERIGPTHPLPDFPSASPESVGLSSQGLQAATTVLQAYIDTGDIPGAVAAVVRDGHLVYHEALGWRDVESRAPMTPDALFRIYSMTRPITSMGVLLLAEDGVLEVNEPVRRFLPDFAHLPVLADPAVPDPQAVRPRVGEITLAHLLTHTSGIGSRSSALYRAHDVHGWDRTLEEVVHRLTTLPLFEDPGTRYRYGMHAEVLGRVVEVATGVSYEAFLTERILGPLGMDDTGFAVTAERAHRLVPVHRADGEGRLRRHPMEEVPVTGDRTLRSAGVGLVSTAADILRFSRALLEEGPTGRLTLLEEGPASRVPLLAREGRERMLANAVPDALFPLGERGYWRGSGWSLGGMAVALDPEAYTHPISLGTAWWDGSVGTRFWVDPTENLIIVVMSQVSPASGGGFREAFKGAVMEAVVESREESGR